MFDIIPVSVPIKVLIKHCNPFPHSPWGYMIDPSEVLQAVAKRQFMAEPWMRRSGIQKKHHVWRIAYLVEYGWDDAIEIDVGCPVLGYYPDWMIEDGNHRYCAAIVLQHETILATVAGQISHAEELFGIKIEASNEGNNSTLSTGSICTG